jgi:hypothetical protein
MARYVGIVAALAATRAYALTPEYVGARGSFAIFFPSTRVLVLTPYKANAECAAAGGGSTKPRR